MAPSQPRSASPLADGFCSALFVLVTASLGEVSCSDARTWQRPMVHPALQQTPAAAAACCRQPPAATCCRRCPRLQISKRVSPLLGLSPAGTGIALVLALLVAMTFLTDRLGGALFNPANNAFLWALGKGSAREHWVRSVRPGEARAAVHLGATYVPPATAAALQR